MPSSNNCISSAVSAKLEFHLVDSQSCQRFCRLALWGVDQQSHPGWRTWGRLSRPRGRRSTTIWCSGRRLGVWKKANGCSGRCHVRSRPTSTIRSTVTLLYDGIRVVTRWLGRLRDWEGIGFVDHTRRAKRRVLNIQQPPRQEAPGRLPRSDQGGDPRRPTYAEQALAASAHRRRFGSGARVRCGPGP